MIAEMMVRFAHLGAHGAAGLLRASAAWSVAAMLLLVSLGWNPMTSLERRPEWSVCGQDLCACIPVPVAEPACPLCATLDQATCENETENRPNPLRWVPDRFDGRIPMAVELMAISLLLPIPSGAGDAVIEPAFFGFALRCGPVAAPTRTLGIEPPPPRLTA